MFAKDGHAFGNIHLVRSDIVVLISISTMLRWHALKGQPALVHDRLPTFLLSRSGGCAAA